MRRLAAIMAADMAGYSRLMEIDEEETLRRQKTHRRELIDPEISDNRGRIVKTTGDGMLIEFASAHDAVRCAIAIQNGMTIREAQNDEDARIRYRIGINVGDVVFDDDDVFGDGVNVAARLESLTEPGGVCLSDSAHQMVLDRVNEPFRDLGLQRVKNISRAIRVWQWTPDTPAEDPELSEEALNQRVQFCRSADDVQIAFATVGRGSPVLKAPNWLNHIEFEWKNPVFGPFLEKIAKSHRLTRFDQRGNGLSDWDVETISQDMMIADMEAVVEAAGLSRFALLGISQGCAFSIRYAAENPEKVTCLVLMGGFVQGRGSGGPPEQVTLYKTARTMIEEGWGSPNPIYRQFFTSCFLPEISPDQAKSFDELQRLATPPENAIRIWDMNSFIDMREQAKKISVPTLVLHCEGDRIIPKESGRTMASYIPGAQFVTLLSDNHVITEGSPAFEKFFEEVNPFLDKYNK